MYIIYSEKIRKKYIGQTVNVEERLIQHNTNFYSGYTKGKGPWRILHVEAFGARSEALKREKELKSGKGRDWIKEKYGV